MDWKELLLNSLIWAGIGLAVLVALWIVSRFILGDDWSWKEYLSRLAINNPVKILTALGFAGGAVIFVLIVKSMVAYLNKSNEPEKQEPVPALTESPPSTR